MSNSQNFDSPGDSDAHLLIARVTPTTLYPMRIYGIYSIFILIVGGIGSLGICLVVGMGGILLFTMDRPGDWWISFVIGLCLGIIFFLISNVVLLKYNKETPFLYERLWKEKSHIHHVRDYWADKKTISVRRFTCP